MKKPGVFFLALAVIFFCGVLTLLSHAAGMETGRVWIYKQPSAKLQYIKGFLDCTAIFSQHEFGATCIIKGSEEEIIVNSDFANCTGALPVGLSAKEVVDLMDELYDEELNQNIPVSVMCWFALHRLQKLVEKSFIKDLRLMYR